MSPQAPFDREHLPPGVDPPAVDDPERIGAYTVVGRVGAGGMGMVYAALDEQGSCVAVKTVHTHLAAEPGFRARFAREVELASRVEAACTAGFRGADPEAATPWMATEYVPGLTLRQYVREHGPLSGGVLTALAVGLAEALVAIHAQGVVHRDLKPGNVILAPDGPKVLDFGIARAVDGTALTRTGGLVGTPGWVSPEQYRGRDATDRSDMFAWGGLVAFAATGRNPFGAGTADLLRQRALEAEPDLDGVPEGLLEHVRRALAKEPGERLSATDALTAITGAWQATLVAPRGSGEPATVVQDLLATEWKGVRAPEAQRVRRPRRGGRVAWAVAAGALAVVLAGGGTYVWRADLLPPSLGTADTEPVADGAGDGPTDVPSEEDALPTVRSGPEDGSAVVAEALVLMAEAASFEAFSQTDSSDPGGGYWTHRYTDDPQPVLTVRGQAGPSYTEVTQVGEGHDEVYVLYAPQRGPEYVPERLDRLLEGELEQYEQWLDNVFLTEDLTIIAETGELAYQGEEPVPDAEDPTMDGTFADAELTDRSGHRYSGTYQDTWLEFVGENEIEFDLWVDEDGYPLRFYGSTGWEEEGARRMRAETIDFVHFNEPVDVRIPDESMLTPAPDGP